MKLPKISSLYSSLTSLQTATTHTGILLIAALASLSACSDPSFSVKGKISDADGKTIILEKADHAGYWVPLDSASLKSSGKFSFSRAAPAAPEIFRLNLDGQYIYFPIDSIESITINAPAAHFASQFDISGSENATAMGKFEKELLAFSPYFENADSAASFKRRVYTAYLQDSKGSVVSYYILTKTIDDKPLFDADADARYFGAVATAFRQFRPDDPRTYLLEQTAMEARHRQNSAAGKKVVVEASEISFIPISLPNENGSDARLSDLTGKGKPVILLISDLSDSPTPALNMELKKLYEAGAVNVYNVGFDADALMWRDAARNLPWTTVYANRDAAPAIAAQYQVTELPTLFLIDANGNLKTRANSLSDIKKQL